MEMRKSDLKGCLEALICSAQEQSIQTNCIKYNIDKAAESPLCRMCGTRNETISYKVSECGKLVQKEHKRRHDSVGRYVHWQFCEKLGFNRARLWYEHEPEIARLWQMEKVIVVPIVVGALGTITTKLEKYIESLGIEIRIEHV